MQNEMGISGGSVVKNPPVNAGDMGSVPELGRCPGKGNGNPHQYPCLGNSMDRGAWQTRVHEVAKSQTKSQGLNNNNSTMLIKVVLMQGRVRSAFCFWRTVI